MEFKPATCHIFHSAVNDGRTHLALMRYWARLMLAGVPVMVIWRSDDPSMALAILICAPDI